MNSTIKPVDKPVPFSIVVLYADGETRSAHSATRLRIERLSGENVLADDAGGETVLEANAAAGAKPLAEIGQ